MQEQPSKRILLTGATGFLGSHLLRAFLDKSWDVSIIKRSFSNTHRIQDLLSKVAILDIDKDPLESIFVQQAPFDAVVHTATCYGRHGETATQVMEANLAFPLNLLETAISFKTPIFLNTGSFYAEGLNSDYLNAYSLSKKQFESWGKSLSSNGKICFINFRLEHLYGPGDNDDKFTTFIFKSLKNNTSCIELTGGEQKRDFVYIDDVVNGYIMFLVCKNNEYGFEEYELGTGEAVSIKAFVENVKRITKAQTKLKFGARKYRDNEIMFSQANTESLLGKIGWVARWDLNSGIKKCIESIDVSE